jgi:DhnA family fructose-bisphosphate aldolase class Ia
VGYDLGSYRFEASRFFPEDLFWRITEVRVSQPELIAREQQARVRRRHLAPDGKLVILAADHPARMNTGTPDDPLGMANRHDYLGRILRALVGTSVDGLMATPDIMDDVFIVNSLVKKAGGPSFLDNRVLIGSLNRSGLAGTIFEMDDNLSAYTPEAIAAARLDGGKALLRLDPESEGSGKTLMYVANAVTALNALGLPTFVEPLPVRREKSGYVPHREPEELMKQMGVASALGASSARTWLKIPPTEHFARVVRATTLPILLLGGASHGTPVPTIEEFASGMQAGGNVRGALVGRNVLYPGKDDPHAIGQVISEIVHEGITADEAIARIPHYRDRHIDAFARHVATTA